MKFILPLRKLLSSPPPHRRGIEAGLHKDEAEFGSGFDDEFAFARAGGGRVKSDELMSDDAATGGEIGEAGSHVLGSRLGPRGTNEEGADGFGDFWERWRG